MDLLCGEAGKTMIVKVSGELDHHFVSEARERIDRRYERGGYRDIVIDLSGVMFMDSSGIGFLIGRSKRAGLNGGRLTVSGMGAETRRIFDMSGLRRLITVAGSAEEAVKGEEIRYAK